MKNMIYLYRYRARIWRPDTDGINQVTITPPAQTVFRPVSISYSSVDVDHTGGTSLTNILHHRALLVEDMYIIQDSEHDNIHIHSPDCIPEMYLTETDYLRLSRTLKGETGSDDVDILMLCNSNSRCTITFGIGCAEEALYFHGLEGVLK